MRSRSSFRILAVLVILVLLIGLSPGSLISVMAAATGSVVANVTADDATPDVGDQIVASIRIDMTGVNPPDNNLGSFTGSLSWDPDILEYNTDSGLLSGFSSGVVNNSEVDSGHLLFNGAKASGVSGNILILTVTFDVILGGTSDLDLEFSAMAAASTFSDLLGILTTNDDSVTGYGTTYNLTVATNPASGGTTTPAAGVHPYNEGTIVNISATPAEDYAFSSWSGDCTGSGICSVTMNADKSVTANFTAAPTPISFTGKELLGRPTDTSVSVKILPDEAVSLYYEYGTAPGVYDESTPVVSAAADEPHTVVIDGLSANTQYFYRMQYSKDGGGSWLTRPEQSFWTQRAKGSTFTFDITTDSHVNILLGTDTTWTNTLNGVANDEPDFLLDLGDTFDMRSKSEGDVSGAEDAYIFQYQFFNIVSGSSPLFIVPGNHEQQEGWHLDGSADSLSVIGTNAQKKYYLNPVPDGSFYTGDLSTYPYLSGDQLKEDYYSWTWGDALFVVINPYWYTETKPYISDLGGGEDDWTGSGDAWDWTLGQTQFEWLKTTLESSNAKYKFVFSHQMVSDASLSQQEDYGHAGANHANLVEWGGYDEDGITWGWDARRPGWGSEPIHDLFIDNEVSAFFHGHDHQYAYEKRDGIVYQTVPAAGFDGDGFNMYSDGDGYTIKALPNSGHLSVTVDPVETTVEYIQTSETTSEYTYTIEPNEVNEPPAFNESDPQNVTMSKNGTGIPFELTLTASDPESDTISWSILTQASHGTASVSGTGTSKDIDYVPDTDYIGDDSFVVQISDVYGGTDTLTVNVEITSGGVPILPSSFYGEIHYQVDDGGPSDGDFIDAFLDDSLIAIETEEIVWDGGLSSLIYSINVPAYPDDTYPTSVTFKIGDRIVAVADWVTGTNVALNVHPPKADAGGGYAGLLEAGSLELAGSYTDWLTSDTFTYAWDLDDDDDFDDSSIANPSYGFSSTGTFEVNLKVTDGQGGEGYGKAPVFVVELNGLEDQVYDGNPHPVTVTGVESPYTTTVLYGEAPGSETPPTDAGTYPILVQIKDGAEVIATVEEEQVIATISHEIDLVSGWNLISFNVVTPSTDIEDVLETIDGKYSLVYGWDASGGHTAAGNWVKYDPNVAYGNTLTILNPSMGFWIYMEEAATLTIIGDYQAETVIPLLTSVGGWNLVGYPSVTDRYLPGVLSYNGVTDFDLVYAYQAVDTADPWKLFDPTMDPPTLNDLTTMTPGWGYWIYITSDADWTVLH